MGKKSVIICRSDEGREKEMTRVEVKNGNVEYALKRFKLKVQRSGVPSEMKKRKEYSKPGVVRREAKKEAIKNARRNNRKHNM